MSKTTNTAAVETPVTETPEVINYPTGCETKSAKIRFLAGEGKSRGQIAKILGIRYQHVRNVLITPLKKG